MKYEDIKEGNFYWVKVRVHAKQQFPMPEDTTHEQIIVDAYSMDPLTPGPVTTIYLTPEALTEAPIK